MTDGCLGLSDGGRGDGMGDRKVRAEGKRFLIYIYIYLAVPGLSGGMWDCVP